MLISSVKTWWEQDINQFQQILFVIACATTLFMLIQLVLMLIGLVDGDSSFDGDMDIDGSDIFNNEGITDYAQLKIISTRTVITFFCMGSWATFLFNFAMPWYGAILLGALVGALAALGVAYVLKAANKLQSSGNIDLNKSVGISGDVYLTIPANRQGRGKVNIVIQEVLTECEAITDNDQPIKTGSAIKVVGVFNQSTLLVDPVNKD